MGRWTVRQYLAALEWLDEQWNRPDRRDHYLMQVALEVRRTISKRRLGLDDFRLRSHKEREKRGLQLSREQAAAVSKARWCGLMTRPINVVEGRIDGS